VVLVVSIASRRNDRLTALIEDQVHQAIGMVGAIGDDMAGR
jgi:hypothetical protein